MSNLIYINQVHSVLQEIQDDHLGRIQTEFYSIRQDTLLEKRKKLRLLEESEKWYPHHPVTIQMRKDFDFEFNL